ncbi:MAG: MATE family efflux transporter [Deltaproteobacteria bacterium]|nr:MATE family efflux transporter [Deltaproteobacteria bacterium]
MTNSLHERVAEFRRRPRRALFRLALPTVTAMAVQTTYNMVDTAFVGRLGATSLAALTFSFPLYFILVSANAGMGVGLNSLISRCLGAGDQPAAENSAAHGLLVALVTATVLFLAGLWGSEPLFRLLGARGEALRLAVHYLWIIVGGNFFVFPAYAIHSIFTAQGDTLTPMKVQITALVANMVLDPLFIFYFHLGVPGAAAATVIAQATGLSLFVYFLRQRSQLRPSWRRFTWKPGIIGEIFRVGVPASLTMLLMSFYIMVINRLMAHFGINYVAAFGMVYRLESVVIMPLVASAISLLTITGMFYGAGDYPLVRRIIRFGMAVNISYALGISLLFFCLPTFFLRVFTPDARLLELGGAYLRIEVFTFPLAAVNITTNRALQGLGRGVPGITINFVRIFVVAIPLAYVFVFLCRFSYLSIAAAMVAGGLAANLTALTWLKIVFTGLRRAKENK